MVGWSAPRQLTRGVAVVLVLWLVVSGAATASGGPDGGSVSAEFFSMSRITPMRGPGAGSTRLEVTISDAPPGNRPNFRWYLDLAGRTGASAGGGACVDTRLAGSREAGRKLAP